MPNQAMHCPKPGSLSSRAMEWLHHFLEPPPRSSGFREERRHLPRQPLQLEVCVTPQNGRPFRTHTTNVSYNGLFVELDREVGQNGHGVPSDAVGFRNPIG